MSLLWIDGELIDKAEARVSPFDHGFLYGDGVWEPLRAFGGKLFRPESHIDCLFASAATLGIDIPLSQTELIAAVEATVRANERADGYVKVIVTRGPGTLGPDPRKLHPHVVIIAEEYQPFPIELYEHGLHVAAFTVHAAGHRVLGNPHVVLAKRAALGAGCLEALLANASGEVVGGTEGSVFSIENGTLAHASAQPPDAIGRVVLELAQTAGIPTGPLPIKLDDALAAEELFLAGTSCGVIGIVQVDGKPIGSGTEGPITKTIRSAYRHLTRGPE